jgi:hypothetical protein
MNGIFPKAVCGMRTKAVSGELGEGREGIASDVKPLHWSFVACCCKLLPANLIVPFVSTLSER